jgi:hypothetical protein
LPSVPGQLSFEGREVSGNKLSVPGLGEMDYVPPEGAPLALRTKDRLVCLVTLAVDDVHHPEKMDKDGNAVDTLKRLANLKALWTDFQIVKVITHEEMEAAWDAAHATQQQA